MDKKIISFLDSYLIIILFVVKEKTRNQSCNLIFPGAPILLTFPSKANVCLVSREGRGGGSCVPPVLSWELWLVKTGDNSNSNTTTSLQHYAATLTPPFPSPHTWSAVLDCNPISISNNTLPYLSPLKIKQIFFLCRWKLGWPTSSQILIQSIKIYCWIFLINCPINYNKIKFI